MRLTDVPSEPLESFGPEVKQLMTPGCVDRVLWTNSQNQAAFVSVFGIDTQDTESPLKIVTGPNGSWLDRLAIKELRDRLTLVLLACDDKDDEDEAASSCCAGDPPQPPAPDAIALDIPEEAESGIEIGRLVLIPA
jgi:hypothetical protein